MACISVRTFTFYLLFCYSLAVDMKEHKTADILLLLCVLTNALIQCRLLLGFSVLLNLPLGAQGTKSDFFSGVNLI